MKAWVVACVGLQQAWGLAWVLLMVCAGPLQHWGVAQALLLRDGLLMASAWC
jgi:hypothetical protein